MQGFENNFFNFTASSLFQGKIKRLKTLRLVTSHHFLYKALDRFGHHHDSQLTPSEYTSHLKRKIVIDNFDFSTKVHDMQEHHQNSDEHWVSVAVTEDRVDEGLSTEQPPANSIEDMDNCHFLPSAKDYTIQRQNYIDLCGRIATEHIACLKPFKDVAIQHIRHKYSSSMCAKTETVSLSFY